MEYGSEESLDFTDIYFMLLNYWTLMESNQIAKERNQVFHNFENQIMLLVLTSINILKATLHQNLIK